MCLMYLDQWKYVNNLQFSWHNEENFGSDSLYISSILFGVTSHTSLQIHPAACYFSKFHIPLPPHSDRNVQHLPFPSYGWCFVSNLRCQACIFFVEAHDGDSENEIQLPTPAFKYPFTKLTKNALFLLLASYKTTPKFAGACRLRRGISRVQPGDATSD